MARFFVCIIRTKLFTNLRVSMITIVNLTVVMSEKLLLDRQACQGPTEVGG